MVTIGCSSPIRWLPRISPTAIRSSSTPTEPSATPRTCHQPCQPRPHRARNPLFPGIWEAPCHDAPVQDGSPLPEVASDSVKLSPRLQAASTWLMYAEHPYRWGRWRPLVVINGMTSPSRSLRDGELDRGLHAAATRGRGTCPSGLSRYHGLAYRPSPTS